ncbi:MAG TPA: nucleotidyltransferase domain-containing protein [Pyrinomonadaceae bacterium]|jgi:predicted nucleotidyltransferase
MTLARNQFDALIDDLKSAHGRNLAAVILYGSAAAGDFVADASDYNLLIALNEIRPQDLRAAQAPMREWQRMGHSVPVYFTVNELKNAADVFPIEFHQMERARKVLYGADVLESLEISDEYLRHQTEYELRSKLIQLRRLYIPASASVENLSRLMIESLGSFAALFRAVLLLHGVEPPITKREVIGATIKHLKINGEPFEKILALREKNASNSLNEVSANELFSAYMREIESVIDAVDKVRQS